MDCTYAIGGRHLHGASMSLNYPDGLLGQSDWIVTDGCLGNAPASLQYMGIEELQCRFFDQHSLAFVALPSPAKANHHGGKCAVLPSTSGQSGVASGQVNQMVEIGTV